MQPPVSGRDGLHVLDWLRRPVRVGHIIVDDGGFVRAGRPSLWAPMTEAVEVLEGRRCKAQTCTPRTDLVSTRQATGCTTERVKCHFRTAGTTCREGG